MIPWDALAGAPEDLQARLTGRYLLGAVIVALPDPLTEHDAHCLRLPPAGPVALCAAPGLTWTLKAATVLAGCLRGREWFGGNFPPGLATALTEPGG